MTDNTQQGLQNQMFGVLIFLFVIISLILQVIPMFVIQRELYEARYDVLHWMWDIAIRRWLESIYRERKCRTYHWAAFVLSNVAAELVWNTGVAVICFLVWFYPMGLFRNARWTGTVHTRSTLVFLVIWSAFLFGSTLAHALIAGAPTAEAASALGNVLGILVRLQSCYNKRKKTLTVIRCTHSPAS
jgi:ATP-binding cassette subfamily G (WHITE) protein 2 (PDR)